MILADLRMRGDDDGFHLIDAVQRLGPRSRIATITGFADAETARQLKERGACLVLQKPLLEVDLVAALLEMLQAVAQAAAQLQCDDESLYAATLKTLKTIACGRFGFPLSDAEELLQETWLLFLEKRHAVREPRSWLSGTVANLCRQEIGRRMKERESAVEMIEQASLPAEDAILSIRQALGRLDPRSRTLCTLIGLEQHSYEEVSQTIDIPLGSVGPLYQRAKARLRQAVMSA